MKKSFAILALVLIYILFISNGCAASKGEGFAVYLTRDDVPPAKMEALSHVDIADQPLLSMNDVIIYNAQTHEIKLTADAFERIAGLEVPVRGKSFVVCVDSRPIYWGAFWTPISSISFDGVTIWKPLASREAKVITLELGYPASSFYRGEDPRNNPEVIKSLEQAGKLINNLSLSSIGTLPHGMKGYELYSWLENGDWHFTLIYGTNRDKTLEEIISKDEFISEAGPVKVQVTGVGAIKSLLSKLPRGEFVLWLAGVRDLSTQAEAKIQLPPKETVDAINEYAGHLGLDFHVQEPN